MKLGKNLWGLVLLVSFLIFASPTFAFTDLHEGDKYFQAVESLTERGILSGHPDGSFRPNDTINRAEFTKLVVESYDETFGYGFPSSIEDTVYGLWRCKEGDDTFSDVHYGEWYFNYVCMSKSFRWIDGNPDGTFRPANVINQVELLKIVLEVFEFDVEDTGGIWFDGYVALALELGFIDEFDLPVPDVSRGEAAEILYRVIEYVENRNKDVASLLSYLQSNVAEGHSENVEEYYLILDIRFICDDEVFDALRELIELGVTNEQYIVDPSLDPFSYGMLTYELDEFGILVNSSCYEMVMDQIESDEDVNGISYWIKAPLHVATDNLDIEMVDLLLAEGADVDLRTDSAYLFIDDVSDSPDGYGGRTPLHYAAYHNNLELVNKFIEQGANPLMVDNGGIIPSELISDETVLAALQDYEEEYSAEHFGFIEGNFVYPSDEIPYDMELCAFNINDLNIYDDYCNGTLLDNGKYEFMLAPGTYIIYAFTEIPDVDLYSFYSGIEIIELELEKGERIDGIDLVEWFAEDSPEMDIIFDQVEKY